MSTSTTKSPPQPGKCVICGTITPTRCSSCSAHGTDWMFFCSKAHQKLVWPTHRRVCGKRSNPLRWPTLNAEEAERIKSVAHKPRSWEGNKTIAQELDSVAGQDPSGFNNIVDRASLEFDLFDEEAANDRSATIAWLRGRALIAGSYFCAERDEDIGDLGSDVFGTVCANEDAVWPPLVTREPFGPWWNELQHRYLLAVDIALNAGSAGGHRNAVRYVLHTTDEVVKLCRDQVSKTNSELARRFIIHVEKKKEMFLAVVQAGFRGMP